MLVLPATAAAFEETAPLSADGRFRAYETPDGVKLDDRAAGDTQNVSVDSDGRWQDAHESDMDYTGRHVVFSSAQPLTLDDTNGAEDVYVRDRACPVSDRISLAPGGGAPAISANGRFVVYVTLDIVVVDRQTGRAAHIPRGKLGPRIVWPAISADGRYVVYGSYGRITADDTDKGLDLFRRDLVTGATERVTVGVEGLAGSDPANPSISADGQVVAFDWFAGAYGTRQAWVRDMATGTTETVTEWPVSSSGRGLDPSISADGTRVAFTGNQMWMDEGLYSDIDSVFVYDRVTHGIQSVGSGLGVLYEHSPELSANGRYVSWRNSAATSEPIKDFGPAAERPVPAFEPFSPACRAPLRSAYRSAVLDDDPNGYWRFGESPGALVSHDEVKPRAGIRNDGTTGVRGALLGDPNRALSFDGHTSLFVNSTGVSSDFGGHAPFSLEAWIDPRSLNGNTRRVFSSEDAVGGYLVGVRAGAGGLVFSRFANNRWSTIKADFTPGRWTHVVATYDTQQVMRLYVDGVRVKVGGALASTISLPTAERNLRIGSLHDSWRFYSGTLDEVAVYGYALGADRVAAHHRLGTAP
jgi:hypothetical protein